MFHEVIQNVTLAQIFFWDTVCIVHVCR